MKGRLLPAALCVVLGAAPVWAQGSGATAPQRADPAGTSAPPADPFKNAGQPESHGGGVQAPLADASRPLAPDLARTVETISHDTLTAQQYGNLASMRHASKAIQELGDRMVVTNSRINRTFVALDPSLRRSEEMTPAQRQTFDSLARYADEDQFGASVAAWIEQHYPPTIAALTELGRNPQFRDIADQALPELKAQLDDARTILRSARATPGQAAPQQPNATGSIAPHGPAQQGQAPR